MALLSHAWEPGDLEIEYILLLNETVVQESG